MPLTYPERDSTNEVDTVQSEERRSHETPLPHNGESGNGKPRSTLKEIREEIAFSLSRKIIELIDGAAVPVQEADEALRLARAQLLTISYIDLNRWREWRRSVDPQLSAVPRS